MAVCNFCSVILGRSGGSAPAAESQQPVLWSQCSAQWRVGVQPSHRCSFKVPKSASLVSHRRRRRRRTGDSILGLSGHKALALLFHLPELTLHVPGWCTVVRGLGRLAQPLCTRLGLAEATSLHCLPCLLVLSSEPVEACHFHLQQIARQKGLSSLSPHGEGAVPVLARAGGPSPSPILLPPLSQTTGCVRAAQDVSRGCGGCCSHQPSERFCPFPPTEAEKQNLKQLGV